MREYHRRGFLARYAILAATLVAAPAAVRGQSPAWDPHLAEFAAQLRHDVTADGVGGVTAAVGVDGRMVWAQGFGWADSERRIPASVETIYRIGSISKSMTAVTMARLIDRGAMTLDDPVRAYLPAVDGLLDAPSGADPITLRQLASHTAGLIREPELDGAAAGPIEQWEQQIHASIPTTRFQDPPGARYSYSNIGYGILGLAIARGVDRPFMELVRELVFAPLGMTSSTFVITGEQEPRLAVGYANLRDGSVNAEVPAREHRGRGYKVPNGGVYSTVADLLRFAAGLTDEADLVFLSEDTRLEVLSVQTPENPTRGYGLGFSIVPDGNGGSIVAHGGSVAGYTAHLAFHPETGIAVVLLRNYNRGATNLGQAARGLVRDLVAASR